MAGKYIVRQHVRDSVGQQSPITHMHGAQSWNAQVIALILQPVFRKVDAASLSLQSKLPCQNQISMFKMSNSPTTTPTDRPQPDLSTLPHNVLNLTSPYLHRLSNSSYKSFTAFDPTTRGLEVHLDTTQPLS